MYTLRTRQLPKLWSLIWNKVPRSDPHLNNCTAQSSATETQKFSPLSILPILFFPFFHRCQKRFHGLCVCVNLPHPFWVLIYPFRFNLPVSGFPRPLIRLWGVDTNTKHTHLGFETRTQTISYRTHAYTCTHNPAQMLQSQTRDTLC